MCVCACVCTCVRVRACVCVCLCVCVFVCVVTDYKDSFFFPLNFLLFVQYSSIRKGLRTIQKKKKKVMSPFSHRQFLASPSEFPPLVPM